MADSTYSFDYGLTHENIRLNYFYLRACSYSSAGVRRLPSPPKKRLTQSVGLFLWSRRDSKGGKSQCACVHIGPDRASEQK